MMTAPTATQTGGGFVMVPMWLLELRPSTNALMAYAVLASFGTYRAAAYEECRPSMKRLSERSGLSESTLKRAIGELMDLGVATRVERRYANGTSAPSVYRLMCPVNAKPPKGPIPSQKEGSTDGPLGDHGRPPTRPPVDPEGVTDGPGRGSPVTHNLEPSDLKPENKNPSSSSPAALICAATGATEEEAEEIVSLIRSGPQIKSWSGLIKTMTANGDLAAKLADVRASNLFADLATTGRTARVPWCGKCSDEIKRQATINDRLTRCPDCHELRDQPINGRHAKTTGHRPWQNDDIPDSAYDEEIRS